MPNIITAYILTNNTELYYEHENTLNMFFVKQFMTLIIIEKLNNKILFFLQIRLHDSSIGVYAGIALLKLK